MASLTAGTQALTAARPRVAARRASRLAVTANKSLEVNTGVKAPSFRSKAGGVARTKLLTRVQELRLLSRVEDAGLLTAGA